MSKKNNTALIFDLIIELLVIKENIYCLKSKKLIEKLMWKDKFWENLINNKVLA